MTESDVTQFLHGQNRFDGFTDGGNKAPQARMEKQWFVVDEQILVKRKPAWHAIGRNPRADAVEVFTNPIYSCGRLVHSLSSRFVLANN
jgi:hypothetical protein